VFVRKGAGWSQQAYLKASTNGQFDEFGTAVSVSQDWLLIGAPGSSNSYTGAAYMFQRTGAVWTQRDILTASNAEPGDAFGSSVALSVGTAVVGARWEYSASTGVNGGESDNSVSGAGAAYVFQHVGPGWSQQAYLKTLGAHKYGHFGQSVSVSNGGVVIGASGDASNATGINGDPTDNSAPHAGAAYIFDNCGGSITEYGSGCAGTGGVVPLLLIGGCAAPTDTISINVVDGLGGASAFLFLGSGQSALPFGGGCDLLTQAPFNAIGPLQLGGVGAGCGSLSLWVFVPSGLPPNFLATLQAFVIDPGSPIGAAGTNGVEIVVK